MTTANRAPHRRWRWLRRLVTIVLLIGVVLPAGIVLAYRVLPVPATPLMAIRLLEGQAWRNDWVSFDRIAPALALAVVASEDNRFCQHPGFDARAVAVAVEEWREGAGLRGASTISQQVAKNLFLWPGSDIVRKGVEAWLTVIVEAVLPKRRIMEIYLNVAEFGPGLYGAEAAARHHFGIGAADLSDRQAALLAAVLPNPLGRDAGNPSAATARRAETILLRMRQVAPLAGCVAA